MFVSFFKGIKETLTIMAQEQKQQKKNKQTITVISLHTEIQI